MTSHGRRARTMPPGLAARLDPMCDEFEAAWCAGQRPRIEDFLPRAAEADRFALLRELLAIEVDYRWKRGETPTTEDYDDRFPDHASLMSRLLADPTVPRPASPAPPDLQTKLDPPPAVTDVPIPFPPVPQCYILEKVLGRGGMGDVWLGQDNRLRRAVAIKVLQERWTGHPNIITRFVAEAQLTSQLQHPAIPPVHEMGELPDGRPYFAMKVIQGRTLDSILANRVRSPEELSRLLGVFTQVCQTVAYAHSKGVIHRDLKPQNIMVGAFGEVQVMDWGLAKVRPRSTSEDPNVTTADSLIRTVRTGAAGEQDGRTGVVGTPAFMPPEQARGETEAVDERADVFGRAILCVILTGQPPYFASSSEDILRQAERGDVAEVLARLQSCGADAELVALATHCLSPKPEGRPRHAGEVESRMATYTATVQERLRKAELERVAIGARVEEERKRKRIALGSTVALLVALFAVGLGVLGAFNGVEELLGIVTGHEENDEMRHDPTARLLKLREHARRAASTDELGNQIEMARREQEAAAKSIEGRATAVADFTKQIILAAGGLALLLAVLFTVFIYSTNAALRTFLWTMAAVMLLIMAVGSRTHTAGFSRMLAVPLLVGAAFCVWMAFRVRAPKTAVPVVRPSNWADK